MRNICPLTWSLWGAFSKVCLDRRIFGTVSQETDVHGLYWCHVSHPNTFIRHTTTANFKRYGIASVAGPLLGGVFTDKGKMTIAF
jgi:hypothetical protein